MKIFYVTLNNAQEAKQISETILQNAYAVCTNWFPIQCAYRQEGRIHFGDEIVLIIKTQENFRTPIEQIIKQHISYNNFIAEIPVDSVNASFNDWLTREVPL